MTSPTDQPTACRGIRGAITVEANTQSHILAATRDLLTAIQAANGFALEDIASVIFTATPDLDADYPAHAARDLGWKHVPLLCMQEMQVGNSLPRTIRVLINWNTTTSQQNIQHVYLKDADTLRPDLAAGKKLTQEDRRRDQP